MPAPKRPAVYIHDVASDAVTEPGIRLQRHTVLAAAQARGWPVPTTYTDHGSGPHTALAQLTSNMAAGRHDAVLALDIRHIGTPAERKALKTACHRHGIPIISLIADPGPQSPGDGLPGGSANSAS